GTATRPDPGLASSLPLAPARRTNMRLASIVIASAFLLLAGACHHGPSGPLPCGSKTCDAAKEICVSWYVEGMPGGDTVECEAIPDDCQSNPSCDCLMGDLADPGNGTDIGGFTCAPSAGSGTMCCSEDMNGGLRMNLVVP